MFTTGTVAIITAATGHRYLPRCVESVQKQTFSKIEHLVVVDGPEFDEKVRSLLPGSSTTILTLPHGTGRDNWCGHRIYAACSFLVNTEYVAFLDEDNWIDPDHVESLVKAVSETKSPWGFSLRKIVDQNGQFVALDNCESLGNLHENWNNPGFSHVDTNCYLLSRLIAVEFAPAWYGQTPGPPGKIGRDAFLCRLLLKFSPKTVCSMKYSVNYSLGERPRSVKAAFFLKGNKIIADKYPNGLPWLKK
ncbi:MAG TPA: glycosyltransferase family A protein [Tepidisphaeraceae bacterium]|nr:glycosyltransferase family A protein [Tepidisphaeraceae bacterium]